jgi:L-fuculose-phosphate aldolase
MLLKKERKDIVIFCQKLIQLNLTNGMSGNISIRKDDQIAISASGINYRDQTEEMVSIVDLEGKQIDGHCSPSSELDFHLAIYQERSDVQAIVHTHSRCATALACLGKELPAVHYMIGCVGEKVPLVPYRVFGSKELADSIKKKLKNYNGLLLENHGVIALGKSIEEALYCAENIEFVADVYLNAVSVGTPKILDKKQMKTVIEKFKNYGI